MARKQVAGYIIEKRISVGSFASVWKGRAQSSGNAVAVKVASRRAEDQAARLRREFEVLRRISHSNVVSFQDVKKSARHFYLVLEYCAGGNLWQFLREHGRLAEEMARRFVTDIAAGLSAVHRENVIHLNLNPQNILLSDSSCEPTLKIADFAISRSAEMLDEASTATSRGEPCCALPLYVAPEILCHKPYDAKADVWSVGVILYELLGGRPPFAGGTPAQLLASIERAGPVVLDGVSSTAQELLCALLARKPAQRLSSQEFEHQLEMHPLSSRRNAPDGGSAAAPPACPAPLPARVDMEFAGTRWTAARALASTFSARYLTDPVTEILAKLGVAQASNAVCGKRATPLTGLYLPLLSSFLFSRVQFLLWKDRIDPAAGEAQFGRARRGAVLWARSRGMLPLLLGAHHQSNHAGLLATALQDVPEVTGF